MVAVKNHEADRFLTREIAGFHAYLVFGSDAGLVSERVRRIAKALVDDPGDPFQLVRLTGDEVAGEAGRLADEANTIPLFGGRRAILVEAGAKSLLPALENHLAGQPACPVVVAAGALKKDAPLRKLVERARAGVAVECYPDDERDVGRLIDAEAAAAGLAVDPDARQVLIALLGADRLASRAELAKLMLYAHGRGTVTLDDVEAVVSDASALATDALVDATFLGDLGALEQQARRVFGGGHDPGVVLGAVLRHAATLHRAKLDLAAGAGSDQALGFAMRMGPRRKALVERQLRGASAEALGRAVIRLGEAVGRVRREPDLGRAHALRTLWVVARTVAAPPGSRPDPV